MNSRVLLPTPARARGLLAAYLFTALTITAAGCSDDSGDGSAPVLDGVADQVVAVGSELVIELRATDEDSSALTYDFSSQSEGIQRDGALMTRPDGSAVFRWRPEADDVGSWFVDFSVSDGALTDTETIVVEVTAAAAGATAPVFRKPLGAGTTLDLAKASCAPVDIEVEDVDTPSVDISVQSPALEGATLESTGGLSAVWTWCPTAPEAEAYDRYHLQLAADDLDHEPSLKNYLVVLRRRPKQDCPGEAPVIEHTPKDVNSTLDITIAALVSDDVGIKREPILYYSFEDPLQDGEIDFASLTPLTMAQQDGDAQSGTWSANIPNPVADQPEGASQTVYYLISAGDNDDAQGDCDHLTDAPEGGTFTITVKNTGDAGGAGLCAPCSADVQCGAADDLCVHDPQKDASYCLQACDANTCPNGHECVPGLESVDGVVAAQCRPTSGTCAEPDDPECDDDAFEPNDTRAEALSSAPELTTGTHNGLVSCPNDDDWYWFELDEPALVEAILDGGPASDLDLGLYSEQGELIEQSAGLDAFEAFEACAGPGTFLLRVHAPELDHQANGYVLDYNAVTEECGPSCEDDDHEDDDDAAQARDATFFPHTALDNAICQADDDWYRLELLSGEKIQVDLTFTQDDPGGDLDLHFFDDGPTDLTPCSEDEPWLCSADQGQSGDSNEHFSFTVPNTCDDGCTYYVVVRGWDGSENDYDIEIGFQ